MARNHLWFDITRHAPESSKVPFVPINDENQRLYRHINFMCHVLWDIPMWIVFGSIAEFSKRVRENVERNDWPCAFQEARDPLLEALEAIDSAGTGPSTVQDLYTNSVVNNPALETVVRACRDLRSRLEQNSGDSVCIPFLEVQSSGNLVPEQALQTNIGYLSAYTLRDLFVARRRNFQNSTLGAIRFMRTNGVFDDQNRGPIAVGSPESREEGVRIKDPINDYKCSTETGTCESVPDFFCTEDIHGNCSAMSDP